MNTNITYWVDQTKARIRAFYEAHVVFLGTFLSTATMLITFMGAYHASQARVIVPDTHPLRVSALLTNLTLCNQRGNLAFCQPKTVAIATMPVAKGTSAAQRRTPVIARMPAAILSLKQAAPAPSVTRMPDTATIVSAPSTRQVALETPATPPPPPPVPDAPAATQSSASSVSSVSSSVSSATTIHTAAPAADTTLHGAAQDTAQDFPAFDHAVFPVGKTPNWGAMYTPAQWNRTYAQMGPGDFVRAPLYDMHELTIPMAELSKPDVREQNIAKITAKLFYSTRYFGAYDLDAGEFTGIHPGVDLKLAEGTPIMAIGGGRVYAVRSSAALGLHVIIEHRLQDGSRFYSIYGHFAAASVSAGQTIVPGQIIGTVGMTGNTSGPHLHLQIDRYTGNDTHTPYMPDSLPSRSEADRWVVNPITFIAQHSGKE